MQDNKVYELTNPQKSIWFTEQYYKGTTINNICGSVLIEQNIDLDLLNTAINKFIENNDSFKIRLKLIDGNVYQYFVDDEFYEFEKIDIKLENEIETYANKMVSIPFEMINSKLFDFKLYKLDNGYGGFIVNAHHLISDAATFSFIATEITSIYSMMQKNEPIPKKEYSYIDYIKSEKDYLTSKRFEKDKSYWNELLSQLPETSTIPSLKNNEKDSCDAERKECTFSSEYMKKINDFCKKNNISTYNFLIAVYSLYIGRTNNLSNFLVGTPILNRTTYAEKHTSGMFISTSILNININDNLNFAQFSQEIAKSSMSLLRHQKYNYQYIIDDLRQKDKTIPNLYNIMLSYQITKATDANSEIKYESKWYANNGIADDIDIHFHDNNNTGNLLVEYDFKKCKYTNTDMENIHKRILHVIDQILSDEDMYLKDIEIVTSEEKKDILTKFNNNEFDYPKDKTIIELFKEQVSKTPNNIALSFNNKKLTYKQLDDLSNTLANQIKKYNVKFEDKIAIFLDKSIEMIVSILAILKNNCAFVPIDITYPDERINYILSDSNCNIILTTKSLTNTNFDNYTVLFLDDLQNTTSETFTYKKVSSNSLAYVMYTSGSTGKPKGVMIEQKNIIRLVINPNYIKFGNQERILQTGSIVFDACTFEIWSALLNGFELYILSKEDLLNPNFLSNYLLDNKITILWLTAPLFNQLCDINPSMFNSVKYLLTGGDVLSPKHINKAMDYNPNLKIINGYGPTENTTFSCCLNIDKKYSSNIPIGYPISGTICYVVSNSGTLQPIGVPGELWVGGDGVGRGYLNREDLTSEKFIANPFGDGKIYKTGDLVRWLPNGTIDFIGRIDNQVKIRGFRVELNEINKTILSYEKVKNSVTIIQNINDNKFICSYIMPKEHLNVEDLKCFMQKTLPNYMIPSYFTIMDNLPITVNGKIDKQKLPIPIFKQNKKNIIDAKTPTEKEILSDLVELSFNTPISINDNFFDDIGLDSLNAMQLCSKLYKYNISIQDISNFPTIKLLAEKIDTHSNISLFENDLPNIKIKNKNVNFNLSNVLLTGTIGFLGIHILKELLENPEVNKIYCLVRDSRAKTYKDRFYTNLNYYFKDSLDSLVKEKVILLNGDFTNNTLKLDTDLYNNLLNCITTVIHCGANVRHYGNYQTFNNTNVKGTDNIIQFCKKSHATLAHISTVSIGGYCNIDNPLLLTENDFNIGQSFNNHVYMITKYLAEYNVLKALNNDEINGIIFRLGNIMPRQLDSIFQYNSKDNAFISRIQTFSKLHYITQDYLNLKFDFSPVDLCAQSILKLIKSNFDQTIYHIYNNNIISVKDLFDILEIDYTIVSKDNFIKYVQDLKDTQSVHLLNDLNKIDILETPVDNKLTINLLNSVDFQWAKTDAIYLKNIKKLFNK